MPAAEPPADLLELQTEFFRADAECLRISDALPSGPEIIGTDGQPGVEVDWTELNAARAKRLDILDEIYAHPFWETLEYADRFPAREALRAAARAAASADV